MSNDGVMHFKGARWYFAAAQTAIAGGLMYWAHADYARTLQRLNAVSITDYWSLPSAILVVLNLPALLITGAFAFFLHLPESIDYAIALFLLFIFWRWAAGLSSHRELSHIVFL